MDGASNLQRPGVDKSAFNDSDIQPLMGVDPHWGQTRNEQVRDATIPAARRDEVIHTPSFGVRGYALAA